MGTIAEPAKHVIGSVFQPSTLPADGPWTDTGDQAALSASWPRRAALLFFWVAGLSLVETFVWTAADLPVLGFAAALISAVFTLLGVFVVGITRMLFLIGVSLYALHTLCLLLNHNSMLVPLAIVLHCVLGWRLYALYRTRVGQV